MNTTRKIMAIISLLAILVLAATAASAAMTDNRVNVQIPGASAAPPEITVTGLKYEPAPAEPGSSLDVWLAVTNKGESVNDFKIKANAEYPFDLPETEAAEHDFPSIPALSDALIQYHFNVDVGASNAAKNLSFKYTYGTGGVWMDFDYPIEIQTTGSSLTVENYTLTPETIMPGDKVVLKAVLRNNAQFAIKDLDVRLGIDGTKFSAADAGTTRHIDTLPAKSTVPLEFGMIADPTAELKVHQIPLEFSYSDERGRSHADNSTISIPVSAQPDLLLTIDSVKVTAPGQVGTVTIKIVNKGVVNLKYVTMLLKQSPDYEILSSSSESYVGNLDSDDYETVEYLIKPAKRDINLLVSTSFKDTYNKAFSMDSSIPLRIVSADEIGQGTSYTWVFVLVAIAVAIGVWLHYRRAKKRK